MIKDLLTAVSFLTIIPVHNSPNNQPGRAFAYFPLIGLLIGITLWGTSLIKAPATVQAFLVLLIWVVITGGLHLDGFADACDGLLATVPAEHRLAIMKDPQVGTWGAVGLIMLLLGKFTLLTEAPALALLVVPTLGRMSMTLAAYSFPYARREGLGSYFRQGLGQNQLIVSILLFIAIVAGISIVANQLIWLFTLTIPVLITLFGGRWAAKRLGRGLTGDVYGGLCELTELVGLFALTLL